MRSECDIGMYFHYPFLKIFIVFVVIFCIIFLKIYEAVLLEGWIKPSRILSLVENSSSYGFFVFNVMRGSAGISEVTIDYVFPVNSEFRICVGRFIKRQL